MRQLSFGTVLKAALVAGLAAGLTVAIFHFLATEPVIERAIVLEDQRQAAAGMHEAPVVSRDVQRVGLFVGYLIYGVVWALLYGVSYHILQRRFPGLAGQRERFLLALAGYWSVGLIPFLKYPANPPGVGDPETIGLRQSLYVGFLVLSVVGTAAALALGRFFGQRNGSGPRRYLPALAFLAAFDLVIYFVLPSNPDEIAMPMTLVTNFRVLSLVGLTLFWAVLGFLFAKLLRAPGPGPVRAGQSQSALGS